MGPQSRLPHAVEQAEHCSAPEDAVHMGSDVALMLRHTVALFQQRDEWRT